MSGRPTKPRAQGRTGARGAGTTLRESEEDFRSLFDNMLNGFAYCRMLFEEGRPEDFVYVAVNPAFEALTGLADVTGKKVSEVIPGIKEANPEIFEIYGRVASTGDPEQFETYVTALGMWFSVSVYRPKKDHFVAVFDVITERKQAHLERETTIEFLRMVNESRGTRDLIEAAVTFFQKQSGCEAVGIRLRVGEDFPYFEARGFPAEFVEAESRLCARDKAGEILRDSAGDPLIECMCGNVICGRFDPTKSFFTTDGSFWSNCTTELLATTTDADRQARTRNRCNGAGYESVALLPLHVGGQRLGLLQLNDKRRGVFTPEIIGLWERLADQVAVALAKFVADEALRESEERYRMELEERVRDRTEQLQSANKELEAFAYSISHDLRAPLRAIDGFASILTEDFEPSLDEEGKRVCSLIRENTGRMSRLIDDLLSFSRLGRAEMSVTHVDMAGMARSVFEELTTPESRERIEFVIDPLPPATADPALIRQVWLNLIGNAIKFSSERDRSVIHVHGERVKEDVIYSVRDNGAGFDMRYAEKLFRVFQRLHSATEFEGTGVGLAIVHRVIARHGGRVWAEGQVDKGATVCFALGR